MNVKRHCVGRLQRERAGEMRAELDLLEQVQSWFGKLRACDSQRLRFVRAEVIRLCSINREECRATSEQRVKKLDECEAV